MRNGDSLAIGEGAQQMPVHHELSDSCGLSAGAKAAGRAQRTVTPSLTGLAEMILGPSPQPSWLARGDRLGS